MAFKSRSSKPMEIRTEPPALVVLHQFRRTPGIPNISPPCLKLETYLRMAKIPYECIFSFKMSKKRKMPWIEYNGQEIADSNFCVEFLSKEFGVDIDDHLTVEQKGMARAILVMLEENTYWSLVHYHWCSDYALQLREVFFESFPRPIRYLIYRRVRWKSNKYLQRHGIGRHSVEELYGIAERDLKAVSACLGEKKFLFGDKPCLADVTLFALVSNFIWEMPHCPQGKLILTQLKNLEDHSTRVKEACYPDWDEITSGEGSDQLVLTTLTSVYSPT